MSDAGFPNISGQPGMKFDVMTITGAGVSSSAQGTGGLDSRGKFTCTCQSDGANQITVLWTSGYDDVPVVVPIPLTADVGVNIISQTKNQFVYKTFKRDDNTTAVNNADVSFFIVGLKSTQVFS